MPSVLIVDDDTDVREMLGELLMTLGLHVALANSLTDVATLGRDALSCDFALLDVNLGPGTPSGLDVYDWLRKHQFSGQAVFLTGHAAQHPLVQEARRLANVMVFQKPIDFDVLERLLMVP